MPFLLPGDFSGEGIKLTTPTASGGGSVRQ